MACRVRYLNSAGIHVREIRGIDALAQVFPPEWLLYASLQCYPAQGAPIEIDAMIATDDQVLLLELKDWNGTLTHNGDQWLLNGQPRARSPVDVVTMKAKRVKTILQLMIPGFSYWVDARVVLTGTAAKTNLSPAEKDKVWDLNEARSIATPSARQRLLGPNRGGRSKVYQLEPQFDSITRNTRKWGALEAVWDGFKVVEEDFVVHPKKIWREHRAARVRDARIMALLRLWSF